MKIITYNVNGLRAAVTKGFPEWLAQEQPDVICLQETKLQPEQYPAEALAALGYKHYLYSAQKKGYSGVAVLTKREPDHVEYGMGIEEYDNEGRFVDSFRVLHPDKQEYTWWSYRFNSRSKNKGWRIDYCMVSELVRPMLKEARILSDAVHSDHCPMLLEIND